MDKIKTAVRILKESEKGISQWIEDNKDKSKFVNAIIVNNKASPREEIIARNQRCSIYYQTSKTLNLIEDNHLSLKGLLPEIELYLFKHSVSFDKIKDRFEKALELIVTNRMSIDGGTWTVKPTLLLQMPYLRDAIQDLIKYLRISEQLVEEKKRQKTATVSTTQSDLTDTESNIVEALGKKVLIGENLAKKAGYPYNSNFKNTLSSLRKRRILGNKAPGYFLETKYHFLISKSDLSQDQRQD